MQWSEFDVEEKAAVVRVAIYAVASVFLVRAVLHIARGLEKDDTYRAAFMASETVVQTLEAQLADAKIENARLHAALDDFAPEHEKATPQTAPRDDHLYPG